MVRKTGFALLLGLVLALPPAVVHALALGEIRVRSALNEPLDAEIPILAARPGELDGLVVGIADPEAFRAAGLERPFLLSRLRFRVVRDARGLPAVRIRTREPVREPVLSFIVEAVWPEGRLLREYTILLDPPVTTAEAPPAVAAPARAAAPAPPREEAPAPAAVREAPAAAGRAVPDRYGPVRRSETLWAIASRLRPGDVTVEQMMVALRDANPEAFVAGDINRLKAGYVLRVPAPEEVRAIDPAAARAEVRRQIAAWRAARRQARKARAPAPQPQARLRLVAPEGEKEGKEPGKVAEAVPGTAAAGAEGGAPEAAGGGAAEEDPAALKARIAELEGRIERMEQLLALKDDELATLQEQLRRLREEAGAAAPQASAAGGEPAGTDEPATGADGEEAAAPPAEGEETAGQVPAEGPPAGEEQPTQVAAAPAGANPYARPDFPRVDLERIRAQPPAAPARAAGGGGGVLEALAANPYSLWAGGAVAVLLAALLLLAIRRRRLAAEDFQESILTQQPQAAAAAAGGAAAGAAGAAADEPTPARVAETGESALVSDFASSDLSALETEAEADPIAEADVYLAYGRYRQAESLIREAIGQDPGRTDLKIKLLEVLHAAGDRAGFEGAVAEHQEALMADEAVWARVLSMGRALAPDNPLFAEEGLPEAGPGESPAEGGPAEVKLADIDLAELEREPQGSEMPEPEETLDFDLGPSQEAPAAEAPAAPPEETASAEEAETPAEAEEARLEVEDTGTIEWEVPEIEPEPDAGGAPAAEAPAELPEAEAPAEPPEAPSEPPETLEEEGAAPAPEEGVVAAAPGPGQAQPPGEAETDGERIEEGGVAAAEGDEAATKLDLARAYMEMGDPEGARELLQEVVSEGSEAQRAEAEALLKQLG